MKRTGNLFDLILDRENLRLAFHKALRGKRDRAETREFAAGLDRRLDDMAEQLRAETIPIGRFHQFVIHDPKERIITAPCFAERVLHHAIINVCEPYLDRWLIADSYACRRGKGRLAALERSRHFARRFPFYLKLDVRKYFDNIGHDRVLDLLARRFKDQRLLDLLSRVVRGYRGALGRGLPIGSLTSQHLANFYLGWFDRFVKETLRIKGYVRYMDDMVLWSADKGTLKTALAVGTHWLGNELGLEWKPTPYLNRTRHGLDFLGCRVFPQHMILNRRSRRRFQRKLAWLERQEEAGGLGESALQSRVTSLLAFTRTPGLCSWRFRQAVLQRREVNGPRARTG